MDLINILFAVISIALGAVGWLFPRYTMEVLDLHKGPTAMGPSEVRAASGALFIGLGVGAIILNQPAAYAMVGFAWGGAAIGRATSLVFDGVTRKKTAFFLIEIVIGLTAIFGNLAS